jgi:Xaa-Pro aminopeptidase
MDHEGRRSRLAPRLPDLPAEAFLITRLPNVRYLTGFTGSNGQLLLTADDGIFFTDGRYEEQSRRQVPGLRRWIYRGELTQPFAQASRELGLDRVAFESAGVTHKDWSELSETGPDLVPTTQEVELLRWVKDADEMDLLRQAQAVADEAFQMVLSELKEGRTEREVGFELDLFLLRRSEGLAFETIMAFGPSAAEPHHRPTDRPLARGDVVKMDFGCVAGGYHSDMTRTVAFGEPSSQIREIYQVVRAAQQAGVDAVRAGVSGDYVDRVTRDLISEAGYGEAYKHGLGHGVGLEIHEGPSLRSGSRHELPSGAVVTVEPGIYLDGLAGVRIEDMVEVTAGGCRVVPTTPKDLIVL